jgi:hypothetical protein
MLTKLTGASLFSLNFMRRIGIVLFLFSCALISCKKDEAFTFEPSIEFKSISPGTIKEFRDSVVITISYLDRNGDLGENETEIPNAFVKDLRNNLLYSFRIRQLAPDAAIAIQGNLSIVIPQVALVNSNSTSETASFEVYIKDRAGLESNKVTTSSVSIVP